MSKLDKHDYVDQLHCFHSSTLSEPSSAPQTRGGRGQHSTSRGGRAQRGRGHDRGPKPTRGRGGVLLSKLDKHDCVDQLYCFHSSNFSEPSNAQQTGGGRGGRAQRGRGHDRRPTRGRGSMKTLSFFYGRCPFPGRLRNNIFQSPRHVFTYLSPSVVFVGITLNLIQSLK